MEIIVHAANNRWALAPVFATTNLGTAIKAVPLFDNVTAQNDSRREQLPLDTFTVSARRKSNGDCISKVDVVRRWAIHRLELW
jgi:hypothetical protein